MLAAALLIGSGTVWAEPMAGLEWVPAGRADSAWIEGEQLSGTLVAEGDGWIDPSLSAWFGHRMDRLALVGSLGLAAINTVTLTASGEDQVDRSRMLLMAVRPGADLRFYLGEPAPVEAWVGGGLYGVVPVVSYTSDTFTEDEQAAYDELAEEDRARILSGGGRVFFGAEHRWDGGLGVGMQASWGLHRAQQLNDSVIRISWRSGVEAAILLSYEL